MVGRTRKHLNMKVSPEAHDRLMAFCSEQGVTLTALLEAIAAYFASVDDRPPRWLADAVREARKIDAERRRR